MFGLIMTGLLAVSFGLSNSRPRIAATLDVILVFVLIFFRIIPGVAGIIDWMIMALLIILAGYMLLVAEMTRKRTWRSYVNSIRATLSGRINRA
jgi:hypothetical protein